MRLLRRAAVTALVLATTTATAVATGGTAVAAPPGNDTYPSRTVVGSIPFTENLDTTEATTDADDDELNAECGAPATDASVWYELTPSTDTGIIVDVSESTYSAGALVATGSPGNWTIVNCAPDAVGFFAVAGETYTILAIDDQFDGGGNGGTLTITIDVALPPPTIDVTVDPFGTFNTRTGSATVSGTVTCTGETEFAFLETELTQNVGRFTIRGFGFSEVTCDGATRPWSLEVAPENGKFAGGKAVNVTFAVACGDFDCGIDFEERVVHLRGKKG